MWRECERAGLVGAACLSFFFLSFFLSFFEKVLYHLLRAFASFEKGTPPPSL